MIAFLREYFALKPHLAHAWRFARTWRDPMDEDASSVAFRDGTVLHVRGKSTDRRILHTIFARDEYRLNGVAPQSLGTVVDVGAHIGIFAARVAPMSTRVISLEPAPANYALLRKNASQPRMAHVETIPKAVAPEAGTIDFFLNDADPSAHSLLPGKEGCTTPTKVEAMTLAQVLSEHSIERCGLLKLDCEGAEYAILESVPGDLWPRIQRLHLEYHRDPDGREAPQLAGYLKERGYVCDVVPRSRHPEKGMLFASRL